MKSKVFQTNVDMRIVEYTHRNKPCRFGEYKKEMGLKDSTLYYALEKLLKSEILIKEGQRKSTTYTLNYDNPETKYILKQISVKPTGTRVYGLGSVDYTEEELCTGDGQQVMEGDLNIDVNIVAPESLILEGMVNELKDDEDLAALSQYYIGIFKRYMIKKSMEAVISETKNKNLSKEEMYKKMYEKGEEIMRQPFAIHVTNRF